MIINWLVNVTMCVVKLYKFRQLRIFYCINFIFWFYLEQVIGDKNYWRRKRNHALIVYLTFLIIFGMTSLKSLLKKTISLVWIGGGGGLNFSSEGNCVSYSLLYWPRGSDTFCGNGYSLPSNSLLLLWRTLNTGEPHLEIHYLDS